MIDLIKKTMMISMGMAYMTKEKVEELAHEFIEKGKLSGQEGREFLNDLLVKSEETSRQVESQVSDIVSDTLKKMNLATQKDVEELKLEIKALKQALEDSRKGS